jgi:hypothetical protein
MLRLIETIQKRVPIRQISQQLQDLFRSMTTTDPKIRFNIDQFVTYHWTQQIHYILEHYFKSCPEFKDKKFIDL